LFVLVALMIHFLFRDLFDIACMIDKENAVQVVGLVLKYLRHEATPSTGEKFSVFIVGAHGRFVGARGLAIEPADGEAAFGQPRFFAGEFGNLRIDKDHIAGRRFYMLRCFCVGGSVMQILTVDLIFNEFKGTMRDDKNARLGAAIAASSSFNAASGWQGFF
jgi:hypothetical protein